jgi:hypothetical protein
MESPIMVKKSKPVDDAKKTPKTLRVARTAIFTALSVVGSFINPYPPIPTIAFDSSPGFFAALYFGILDGILITGIGHLVTVVVHCFYLGNLHFPIAVGMALAGGAMGLLNKTNKKWGFIPAAITGVVINTALSVILVPSMGWATVISVVAFPLLLAASLNAIVAVIVYLAVRARRIRA